MHIKIRVVIAAKQELLRIALHSILNDVQRIEIVGEVADCHQLFQIVDQKRADIILLDDQLPLKSGIETLIDLQKTAPRLNVIVISAALTSESVEQLMALGANSNLDKDCSADELIYAILAVQRTGFYFSQKTTALLSDAISKGRARKNAKVSLSEREIEVLLLKCKDCSTKEVASALSICECTVLYHVNNIRRKTKFEGNAGFLIYALKNGLTTLENYKSLQS